MINLSIRGIGILSAACFFLVAAFAAGAEAADEPGRQAVPESDAAEAELTALLQDFLANSGLKDTHARFWADDLVYTSSNGTRFGKAEIMEGFAAEQDGAAAEENAASEERAPSVIYSGEDINVQVFGTTAVVTFRLVGTPDDGSPPSEYFNSGTFLKRQGVWQAVSWQATAIPEGG